MLLSFVALLVAQLTPATSTWFNNIPPGPIAIMSALLYQYMRLVPPAYHFRIFGLGMSDKVWVYAIAAQVGTFCLPWLHGLELHTPMCAPLRSLSCCEFRPGSVYLVLVSTSQRILTIVRSLARKYTIPCQTASHGSRSPGRVPLPLRLSAAERLEAVHQVSLITTICA